MFCLRILWLDVASLNDYWNAWMFLKNILISTSRCISHILYHSLHNYCTTCKIPDKHAFISVFFSQHYILIISNLSDMKNKQIRMKIIRKTCSSNDWFREINLFKINQNFSCLQNSVLLYRAKYKICFVRKVITDNLHWRQNICTMTKDLTNYSRKS